MERDFKLVFSAATARKLLKLGYQITDVKSSRYDSKKTVFVFKNTEELPQLLKKIEQESLTK